MAKDMVWGIRSKMACASLLYNLILSFFRLLLSGYWNAIRCDWAGLLDS
jgi:hypothetical protein